MRKQNDRLIRAIWDSLWILWFHETSKKRFLTRHNFLHSLSFHIIQFHSSVLEFFLRTKMLLLVDVTIDLRSFIRFILSSRPCFVWSYWFYGETFCYFFWELVNHFTRFRQAWTERENDVQARVSITGNRWWGLVHWK